MPIHDIVENGATNWARRPAVVFEDRAITFAELARESARLASGLRAVTDPGDRVAILARNIPEYVECQYGVPRARLILTLLNYRLHPEEWAWILTDAGARVLVVQYDLLAAIEPVLAQVESLEHVVVIGGNGSSPTQAYEALKSAGRSDAPPLPIDESAPAYLIYTSGTTGFPKGAVISHRAARMAAVTNALESELRADDSFLMTFPMCHASGFQVQNVYPTEVERVLHELPGIAQVAVVGAADPVYGERVVAFVVLGADTEMHGDDVIAHCRAHLASYKKPSQVVFVDDLPKTITGKVKKQDLRALL